MPLLPPAALLISLGEERLPSPSLVLSHPQLTYMHIFAYALPLKFSALRPAVKNERNVDHEANSHSERT